MNEYNMFTQVWEVMIKFAYKTKVLNKYYNIVVVSNIK